MNFVFLHDTVEANSRTIKENNLEKRHNIPIDSLVEVKFDDWFGGGACWKVHARLWVDAHTRDCDGTPLYTLCSSYQKFHGFSEESLTLIKITDELVYGTGALEWGNEVESDIEL